MTAPTEFYLVQIHFDDNDWINAEGIATSLSEAVLYTKDHYGQRYCKGIRVLHIALDRAPVDVTQDVLERIEPYDDGEESPHDTQRAVFKAGVGAV